MQQFSQWWSLFLGGMCGVVSCYVGLCNPALGIPGNSIAIKYKLVLGSISQKVKYKPGEGIALAKSYKNRENPETGRDPGKTKKTGRIPAKPG